MININYKIPIVGIYKITSPSGKVYIGQSINIERRIKEYKNLYCKKQIKLYNSLVKYGFQNHQFEIIEECDDSILNEIETWWKLYFNSVENGLNCNYWDNSIGRGKKMSSSSKEKIRIKALGRKDSELTRIRKSNAKINKPRSINHNLNLRKSINETLKNKGFSEERNNKLRKPVIQYSLDGVFIKEWSCAREITKNLKIYNIEQVCKKKKKSAGGYIWIYK